MFLSEQGSYAWKKKKSEMHQEKACQMLQVAEPILVPRYPNG